MTSNASSTRVSTSAASSLPTRHDVGDMHPVSVWRAVRNAFHFVLDVANEASDLRRSLHRRYSVIEE